MKRHVPSEVGGFVGFNPRSVALILAVLLCVASILSAQQVGGIRGTVYDKDFDVPLASAQVLIVETGEKTTTTDEGNYVFGEVAPGTYTLAFSKEGYTRQLISNVTVSAGQMNDVSASLAGEFTEMEEFVVQDLALGGGTEIQLLQLRAQVPSFLDSIGSEVMSQAGVSDAASALRLVSGATVEDGKYAVVRGLPDRYVSSQLNSVRLPTADVDKRAVQLDQFPAALVESIQVKKTFTPDQQGDASGGAVNVVLKGIPRERVLRFKGTAEYNSQVRGRDDFLTYRGGGPNFLGIDDDRDIPGNGIFEGPMGTHRDDAPLFHYSGSATFGDVYEYDTGLRIGAIGSTYYKREQSYFEDGKNDIYEAVLENGTYVMKPFIADGDVTSLFDVTEGVDSVKWGLMGALGAEFDRHAFTLLFMRTQVAEDEASLLEDTRGRAIFGTEDDPGAFPFHRNQTLEYIERSQTTVQLKGRHTLPAPALEFCFARTGDLEPEIDWTLAHSVARLDSPDKRVFSSKWQPERVVPLPPPLDDLVFPPVYTGFDPGGSGESFAQRIWKDIREDSDQVQVNGKLPFEQWSGEEGYFQTGLFNDQVDREFDQDSFIYDTGGSFEAPWEVLWTDFFVGQNPEINDSDEDVDYTGKQNISAWYYMFDLPFTADFKFIGGQRFESTELNITNEPESTNARYLPPDGTGWTRFGPEADVEFSQDDILPSVGFEYTPIEKVKLRASYSETVARQTFKELSPVMQFEFLGADIFVGNPELTMSALKNYDLRIDYEPYTGGLLSASWFRKDITNPIEVVQRFQASLFYTTPVNYPEGWLEGYELEARQDLGRFWDSLEGFSAGANATIINSEVTLPADEAADFAAIGVPIQTRDMTNAPEFLYNLNLTYESPEYGTRVGIFYTVRGDTLAEGGVALGREFLPDVYEKQFGTLNIGVTQPVGEHCKIAFQAKNITNPEIQRVYRSDFVEGDTVKTSFKRGVDLNLSLIYEF